MGGEQRPSWAVRIESERVARGWGKFTLARHLFSAVGIDRHDPSKVKNLAKQITRHERGEVFPTAWADAYATAFELERDALFPSTAGTSGGSSAPDDGDDDVDRRAALRLIAVIGTDATVPPGILEDLHSSVVRVLERTVDVEAWEQAVRDYCHLVYRRPFDALIPDLATDIVAVGELLEKGRSPRDQAGLLRVSASLSSILAEMLCNVGDERAARRTWSLARQAADASGDRATQIWVRGRAAQHISWAGGSHQTVMTLVDEAIQIADGSPFPGLPQAYAAGAYQTAHQMDLGTARDSLNQLKRAFDRVPHSRNEQTILLFQESQLRWSEAYVETVCGDKRAEAAVDHARALYPDTAQVPITNLHLMRAIGLTKEGEVGEGLELAATSLRDRPRPVLATRQLVEQLLDTIPDSARALPSARELHALLSPKRTAPTDFSR